ncbi:MAG: preprotein translocase subunit SecG [Desulfobacterales bacterium]|jgi:preprotein translocase subunit SecG
MSIILIVVHVAVCIALIMIVLLQTGKGADMGAAFGGGGSQTLFGSTGASTFLSKATTVAAIVFMLTSLTLAYMSSHRTADSIMKKSPAPVEQPAAAAPGETAPEESSAPAPSAPATQEQAAPQASDAPAKPAQSE